MTGRSESFLGGCDTGAMPDPINIELQAEEPDGGVGGRRRPATDSQSRQPCFMMCSTAPLCFSAFSAARLALWGSAWWYPAM